MRGRAVVLGTIALAACKGGGGGGGGPGVRVVDMVPVTLSGETNQDAEPFLAVHPTNRGIMVASVFTPNPAGSSSTTAPIFVTQDTGRTWALRATVPSVVTTADMTEAFDGGNGDLFAGILQSTESLSLNELITHDALATSTMTVQASRSNVDQPFTRAITIAAADRVYIGMNDFNATPSDRTATVDVSLNGGASYTSARIEGRGTGSAGQNGPSIRPSLAADKTVYVAYFGWRSFTNGIATSDVVVVRDDSGAARSAKFRDLTDPGDHLPGRIVAKGVKIPFTNASTLGQVDGGAVDPNHSATVYLAWAD